MKRWVAGGVMASALGAGATWALLLPPPPLDPPVVAPTRKKRLPLRVRQTHSELTLQVSVRSHRHPDGRVVVLMPAIHLADAGFYDQAVEALEAVDVVLYEGIEPKVLDDEDDTDSDVPTMADLAEAIGLAAQEEAVEVERPGWINSDLSEEELERLLLDEGAPPELVAELLSGGLSSGLTALLEGLKRDDPRAQVYTAILVVQTILRAEELIAADRLGPWQEILIERRNDRVLVDLDRQKAGTVGIWYGALHTRGLEQALRERGYVELNRQWIDAIRIDTAAASMSPMEVDAVRKRANKAILRRLEAR